MLVPLLGRVRDMRISDNEHKSAFRRNFFEGRPISAWFVHATADARKRTVLIPSRWRALGCLADLATFCQVDLFGGFLIIVSSVIWISNYLGTLNLKM